MFSMSIHCSSFRQQCLLTADMRCCTPLKKSSYTVRSSLREWQQYNRYMRYQRAEDLPCVSWSRYHLAVLFVDRTDTVRAKVAAGIFDRIATWNGFGRALYSYTAGTEANGQPTGAARSAGLMSQAGFLKIPPKLFSRPGVKFEEEDLDRNEIILAVDGNTRARITDLICKDASDCQEALSKIALLTDFRSYLGQSSLMRRGGSAILEPELMQILEPALLEAQQATMIHSPNLTYGSREWNLMVQIIICSCAGLVQFLIDAWPPDLPDYDPL